MSGNAPPAVPTPAARAGDLVRAPQHDEIGRTALSNVVLQWIVISTLLFGYGFGLLDRIGTLSCVLLSIPIFAGELWLSRWWLARHRFGPLEWLWRTMTYGHLPRASDTAVIT